VFVVRLRNGDDLKIQIQSLIGGVYTFRYANLDGSGETMVTVDKADHTGKLLAYFSFATGDIVDVEPTGSFDLLFCRYTALLHNPQGGDPIPYLVTGILSGGGVEVAQADNVDPQTVEFADFADSLSTDIEVIGHDWKFFDLGQFQWILSDNLVYFVRTTDEHVWQIRFTSFGGSGNGNAVFEKTDLGIVSAVEDPASSFAEFNVFPNPVADEMQVAFTVKQHVGLSASVQLMSAEGKTVYTRHVSGQGLHVVSVPCKNFPSGMYFLTVSMEGEKLVEQIQILK